MTYFLGTCETMDDVGDTSLSTFPNSASSGLLVCFAGKIKNSGVFRLICVQHCFWFDVTEHQTWLLSAEKTPRVNSLYT